MIALNSWGKSSFKIILNDSDEYLIQYHRGLPYRIWNMKKYGSNRINENYMDKRISEANTNYDTASLVKKWIEITKDSEWEADPNTSQAFFLYQPSRETVNVPPMKLYTEGGE